MKKARALAWLLVVALLAMACPAFADQLNVELADGAALEMPNGIATDDGGLTLDPGIDMEGIDVDLPGLDLSDGLTDNLFDGVTDAVENNGKFDSQALGANKPQGNPDNDALFAGYVDMLFGKKDTLGLQRNGWVGDRFTGVVKKAYDYLLKQIKKIAAGTVGDTILYFPKSIVPSSSYDKVAQSMDDIIYALLADCPYHFFWFDKTTGWAYNYDNKGLFLALSVAQEYALKPDSEHYYLYKTDTALIQSAQVAVKKAKSVVKKYAGVSDYKKLCGYRDFICKENDYNHDAVNYNWPYGNPWQLIWVFDGDPNTKVVCEGYSKAFQYLCDLSSFSTGVQSHIVEGDVYDSSGGGAHMWNIVTMGDGKNYHVDITFVDGGFTQAFLCGAEPTQSSNQYCVANDTYYVFDDITLRTYPASVLKLATSDFDPSKVKVVKSVKLKKGTKTLKKGQSLSLQRGKSLTLKAVVSPSGAKTTLTWNSNKNAVTVKNGKVTVSKSAKVGTKAKITVTTANGKSTYVYIVVKK